MKPEQAQKRLDQLKQRQKGRSDFWRPAPGENHVRFLPRWDGDYDGEFFRETAYHRNLGPDKDKSGVCLRYEGQDKCPVCEVVSDLYKTKQKEDSEFAKTLKAQTRAIYNIIDLDEPEKGPQIYMSGVEAEEQILRYIANPKYGDISDPQRGRNCTLIYTEGKDTKSGFPSTTIQPDPDTTALADMEWLEKMADLDGIVKPIGYDELHALLWGEQAPAPEERQASPKEERTKEKAPAPSCLEKGKFSKEDTECMSCDYSKPCEDKKKVKPAEKPVEKSAEKPKTTKTESKGSESIKDLLNKLKAKKGEEASV